MCECVYLYIYIYIYIISSTSTTTNNQCSFTCSRHRSLGKRREVFSMAPSACTKLKIVNIFLLANIYVFLCLCPLKNLCLLRNSSVFVKQSPVCLVRLAWVHLWNGGWVVVQCCFCSVLLLGLVQNRTKHPWLVPIYIFLQAFMLSLRWNYSVFLMI